MGANVGILLWIGLSVAVGYLLWAVWLRRVSDGERHAGRLARGVSRLVILGSVTPLMVVVTWTLAMPAGKMVALPFVGLFANAVGGLAAWLLARSARLPPEGRGACFLSGGCSNVLAFGGVITVHLLVARREAALADLIIYRLLEGPYFFLLAWPLAGLISSGAGWKASFRRAFRPVTLIPIGGIVAGGVLNAAGIDRPALLDGVAEVLVHVNVVLMGIMSGLTLRRAAPIRHLGWCLRISLVKFALVPASVVALAWLLGFRGTSLQVVAIAGSMPVAFMAVAGANLFGLDEERVASYWLFTTAGMVVVVPALTFVLPRLPG